MAQNCLITDGIDLDCIDGIGGISTAWVLGGTVTSYTLNGTDQVSGLTGTGTFYKYELSKDTATFTETITVAPTEGTVFYQQELTLNFLKLDATKRNQIKLLAKNRNLKVAYLDNNGNYMYLGASRGLQMSAGSDVVGANPGDGSKWSITLQGMEPSPANFIVTSLSAACSGSSITVE